MTPPVRYICQACGRHTTTTDSIPPKYCDPCMACWLGGDDEEDAAREAAHDERKDGR